MFHSHHLTIYRTPQIASTRYGKSGVFVAGKTETDGTVCQIEDSALGRIVITHNRVALLYIPGPAQNEMMFTTTSTL